MLNIKKSTRKKLFLAGMVTAGLIWMGTLYNIFALPYTLHLKYFAPRKTAFMGYHKGKKDLRYKWVDLENISPYLKQAVVLAEDDRFYSHGGYDLKAIEKVANQGKAKA